MKKTILFFLTAVLLVSSGHPVFAYNYEFNSGADITETFGKPTQTDEPAYNPQLENIRRNKDASYIPPAYGIFSGEIPTEPSSRFHSNPVTGNARDVTNYSVSNETVIPSVSADASSGNQSMATSNPSGSGNYYTSTSLMPDTVQTLPSYYSDGSMGILTIPKLNKTIKVYEGETLANMKNGAAHFESTSAWDGNCAIAGHNRGSSGYFQGVKNLKNGDMIIYETPYGKRTYEVYYKEQISDTDFSLLNWSNENIITLITCVEGNASMRWAVVGKEVR